jgi:hypothetical protein
MSVSADAAHGGVPSVDVVPLGGLGEFGLNMMAISCEGTTIVIDAGAMFPETDLLGVDLIVTQAVCEVCAVSFDDVRAVAERLPTRPQVISLDPHTLGEMLGDVRTLAGHVLGIDTSPAMLARRHAAPTAPVRLAEQDHQRVPRIVPDPTLPGS